MSKILRYALPGITIVLAILGAAGIKPFGWDYDQIELLLALVALLAIDTVLERFELLNRIGKQVDEIARWTTTRPTSGVRLITRSDQEKVGDIFRSVNHELTLCGPMLDVAVHNISILKELLERGCKIRLLMVSPTPDELVTYSRHVTAIDTDLDTEPGRALIAARLENNMDQLRTLAQVSGGSFELRALDRIMWLGILSVDQGTRLERLDVQLYLYRIPVQQAPILQLDAVQAKSWSDLMLSQFETYWADATEIAKSRG